MTDDKFFERLRDTVVEVRRVVDQAQQGGPVELADRRQAAAQAQAAERRRERRRARIARVERGAP